MNMDKDALMRRLFRQPATLWFKLLGSAYDAMDQHQREAVFGEYAAATKPNANVDAQALLRRIKQFHGDSFAGKYYAAFNVNSRNWSHIPKSTSAWFDRLGEHHIETMELTRQGLHTDAVTGFSLLYDLVAAMEAGQEIVFADELGSWMIPVDESKVMGAYLKSLAAIATPEHYAQVTIPLIKRDARHSFSDKVYATTLRAAKAKQKAYLLAEIKRQHVETGPLTSAGRQPRRRSSSPGQRRAGRR